MNLDDLLKSIKEEDDDSKGGKDLDDLLESIREESIDNKKIDPNKFLKRKTFENPLKGQRFTAPEIIQKRPTTSKVKTDKIIPKDVEISEEFNEKLDELIAVIKKDNELEEERKKFENNEKQKEKRKNRENRIENKKRTKLFSIDLKKGTGRISNFFDDLMNFLTFAVLGGLVSGLYNFIMNPENDEKIRATQKFLRENWPILLGAAAYFLTPLGGLVNFLVKTVAGFSLRLGALMIKYPLLAAALVGAAGIYATGKMLGKDKVIENEAARQKALREELKEAPSTKDLSPAEREALIQGSRLEDAGGGGSLNNMPNDLLDPLGLRQGFDGGGFAMGTDTVPSLLTPGEVVMNKPTVNAVGAENLLALNKIFGGPNANRPKFGMVTGYQNGGYVGFAKKMIQEHEGYNIVDGMHQAYRDSKGLPTIGYGHLIAPGDGYSMSSKISQQEADKLFDKDFKYHSQYAQKIPGFGRASNQQKAALIDLTFNMGPAWHKDFPGFVKAFSAGDYETAANQIRYKDATSPNLQDSDYYKDVGPRRANPIISLIRNKGIGNSPHLKGFENLLPVSKSTNGIKSVSTAPGSLGPAFSDNTSMKDLSKQQLLKDRLNSIGRKLSDPINTFVFEPLRRTLSVGTPNIPTETRNFMLPPIETPKQNRSTNQVGDVPSFNISSENRMRDFVSKKIGIHDLVGA